MRTMGRFAKTALAAAVFVGVMSARSDAGAIEVLPSNVTAFVYVKDIAELNSHASAMATAANLTELSKDFADPLAYLKSGMPKNGAGIRDSGDFVIAFVDSTEPNMKDSTLVLVPITDFDAFVTNFADEKGTAPVVGENGIVPATCKGKKVFLARWGDYAAVGHSEKAVATPEKSGLTLDDWTKKQIESNDVTGVVLTGEMYRIDPNRTDKIIQHLNKLSGMAAEMSGGMMPAQGGEMVNQKMTRAVIERFISDAEVGVMGLSFSEKGIRFNARTQFKTGTYLANMLMKSNPPEQLPIDKIPNDNYMMYGAMAYDSAVAVEVMDDFLKKMGGELNTTDNPMAGPTAEQFADVRDIIASGKSVVFATKAWSMSEKEILLQPGFAFVEGDGAKLKDSVVKLTKSAATTQPAQKGPRVDVKLTEDARTLAGVSFVQVDVEAKGVPMAGLSSSTSFYGATQNGLFVYRDMSDEAVTNILPFNNADSITQSEGYKFVAADLPANRCGEFYLQPEQLASSMGMMVMQMFGMQLDLTPPTGLPPIGFAFACDDRVLSAEMVIPSKSIAGTSKFVTDAIKKLGQGAGDGKEEGGPKADEDI